MTDNEFAEAIAHILFALPADALAARMSLTLLCQERAEQVNREAKRAFHAAAANLPFDPHQ